MAKSFSMRRLQILEGKENASILIDQFPAFRCIDGVSDLNISCMFHTLYYFMQIMNEVNMINIKMIQIWTSVVDKILDVADKEKEHLLTLRAVWENFKCKIHASC